ncbi:MAG: iron-containing alcohol dehydrogenase, partial [Pseudomonadota bacterium]
SVSPNNNPMSQMLARNALALISRSLLTAVESGDVLTARSQMLLGSMFAGQSFANSPVAAVHALAYPLGGHFKIPHGLSNALVLPHVLRFNSKTAPEPYAEIAPFAFPELVGLQGQDRAEAFCEKLAELSTACGLQQSLREMNIPRDNLPALASDAMNQTRLLVNNPREITEIDALAIYNSAY